MSGGSSEESDQRRRDSRVSSTSEAAGNYAGSGGGWNARLVESRPGLDCPVCLCLLNEPYLTNCCGKHFCRECIERVAAAEHACPVCRAAQFGIFPNLEKKREVMSEKVHCLHEALGCDWTGELGQMIDKHLKYECRFILQPCPFECGQSFLAKDLPFHKGQCPKMPLELVVRKLQEEQHHLMSTVNGMSKQLAALREENKALKRDLAKANDANYAHICKLYERQEEVQLQLAGGRGRTDILTRDLSTQADKMRELINTLETLQKDKLKIEEEIKTTVEPLKAQLNQMSLTVHTLPPLLLVMNDFNGYKNRSQWWQSQPFYSHQCGYKFRMEVKAAGMGNGAGTHVSVYIHVLKGEYDDKLKWPLTAAVHFRLVNHFPAGHHFESKVFFASDNEASLRVTEGRAAGTGRGYSQFIPLAQLAATGNDANAKYLKNDTLTFEITKIDFK